MRRVTGVVLRLRYLLFIALAGGLSTQVWFAQRHTFNDLYYFIYGGRVFAGRMPYFHGSALHLYARHPDLQIGPPALALNAPLTWVPLEVERAVWLGLIFACALVVVRAVESMAPRDWRLLLYGTGVLLAFWEMARWQHLDDALAIAGIAVAVATLRKRWWVAALALGFAAAAKPWAVIAVPLLLALPRHQVVRAGGLYLLTAVGPWLPFIVGDPRTISALGSLQYPVAPWSGLRALGVQVGSYTPSAVHLVEMLAGIALGTAAVLRGKWAAVPLLALCARLVLEPRNWAYYAVAPIVAALLWDVAERHRVPWWAFGVAAVESGLVHAHAPSLLIAWAQVGLAVVVAVSLLARPKRPVDIQADVAEPEMVTLSQT